MKLGKRTLNLIGMKFGRLIVQKLFGYTQKQRTVWECKCDCGAIIHVETAPLKRQHTRSCGCLQKEIATKRPITHGLTYTSEYRTYYNAKQRCENSKFLEYENYGGRGIQFKFSSFEDFFSCMGLKPTSQHTLDRINNNGHYERGNVRWATRSEQNLNKRTRKCIENFSNAEIKREFLRRGLIV